MKARACVNASQALGIDVEIDTSCENKVKDLEKLENKEEFYSMLERDLIEPGLIGPLPSVVKPSLARQKWGTLLHVLETYSMANTRFRGVVKKIVVTISPSNKNATDSVVVSCSPLGVCSIVVRWEDWRRVSVAAPSACNGFGERFDDAVPLLVTLQEEQKKAQEALTRWIQQEAASSSSSYASLSTSSSSSSTPSLSQQARVAVSVVLDLEPCLNERSLLKMEVEKWLLFLKRIVECVRTGLRDRTWGLWTHLGRSARASADFENRVREIRVRGTASPLPGPYALQHASLDGETLWVSFRYVNPNEWGEEQRELLGWGALFDPVMGWNVLEEKFLSQFEADVAKYLVPHFPRGISFSVLFSSLADRAEYKKGRIPDKDAYLMRFLKGFIAILSHRSEGITQVLEKNNVAFNLIANAVKQVVIKMDSRTSIVLSESTLECGFSDSDIGRGECPTLISVFENVFKFNHGVYMAKAKLMSLKFGLPFLIDFSVLDPMKPNLALGNLEKVSRHVQNNLRDTLVKSMQSKSAERLVVRLVKGKDVVLVLHGDDKILEVELGLENESPRPWAVLLDNGNCRTVQESCIIPATAEMLFPPKSTTNDGPADYQAEAYRPVVKTEPKVTTTQQQQQQQQPKVVSVVPSPVQVTSTTTTTTTARVLHEDLRKWSVSDVAFWVRQELQLEKPSSLLQENEVDGSTLADITAEDLKGIGITQLGHWKKILRERDGMLSSVTRLSLSESMGGATTSSNDDFLPSSSIELVKRIGGGHFGEVWMGLWHKKTPVAVKWLSGADASANSEFAAEVRILQRVRHPHVVSCYGLCLDEATGTLRLVTELLDGSLLSYLRDNIVDVSQMINLSVQVCSGMDHLIHAGILHRDLAARNVLIRSRGTNTAPEAKLCDFGLGREMKDDYYTVSTPGVPLPIRWTAPEALEKKKFSPASDVWSFGILMWEVFSGGCEPYADWAQKEILKRLRTGERMDPPQRCPDAVATLMSSCWKEDPKQRPTFESLYNDLVACEKAQEEQPTKEGLESTGEYFDAEGEPIIGGYVEEEE